MTTTRLSALGAVLISVAVLSLVPAPAAGAQAQGATALQSQSMAGITTFHRVSPTIACGANGSVDAMAPLKEAGFATVISFSEDAEPGYDRVALERAATAAGLRYVSIPFNRDHPDPAAVDRFLKVIATPSTGAAYLSCHTGQRAAMMWAIKRIKQDGWKTDQAFAEAESLGLTRPELKRFALQYVANNDK